MIITSSCELLAAANNLSPKQQQQLARINRASIEMHDLVKTFLLLARDSLQQDTDTDVATLEAIAIEQYEQWHVIAETKGLTMQIDVLHANNTQYKTPLLRAVIANLLRNAVHYTDTGFVKLVVDGSICRVEDSGQGIEPEQREAVFQPFVRGTQARGEGMGLGLSLVKRICLHEGWRIELTPLQPQGSCFAVDLNPPMLTNPYGQ
jgi:signal transduction histidine kinase